MDEISQRADQLKSEVVDMMAKLKIADLESELNLLDAQSKSPDFWKDNLKAQQTMKRISNLESRVKPWREIEDTLTEIEDWLELDDDSVVAELETKLDEIETKLGSLKKELRFTGIFDDKDALISIHAGAGGTDAQDWSQMLLR